MPFFVFVSFQFLGLRVAVCCSPPPQRRGFLHVSCWIADAKKSLGPKFSAHRDWVAAGQNPPDLKTRATAAIWTVVTLVGYSFGEMGVFCRLPETSRFSRSSPRLILATQRTVRDRAQFVEYPHPQKIPSAYQRTRECGQDD